MIKKKLRKIFGIQKDSAGFTLIELLVAISLTTIVVGIAGFGLVTIVSANKKEEAATERQVNLTRALDFISDQIRMASSVSDSAPTWAANWDLDGVSPSPKLYVQIPQTVLSMTASNDEITITNHNLSDGNAVIFTGFGTLAGGLLPNVKYYVTNPTANTFKVSTSLSNAQSGTAIDLTSNSSGNLIGNRLLIFYIRNNTSTWFPPNIINRSAGPCPVSYTGSNCLTVVDSIAENGFTAIVTSSRQAEIALIGSLNDNSTQTYKVSTKAFARSFN